MGKYDFTGGDHSFKNWFKIMWGNTYIQLFIVFLTLLVFQIIYFQDCLEYCRDAYESGIAESILMTAGMLLPIGGVLLIGILGFIRFWNDLKNGRSR